MSNNQSVSNAQPRQIVCLEHQETYLYGEVIQVIRDRQLLWFRPLLLVDGVESKICYDLRSASDLVWPSEFFRPAFDTEVIPVLAQLNETGSSVQDFQHARRTLNYFINQFWQTHRNQFPEGLKVDCSS